jgi:hypothetical protein
MRHLVITLFLLLAHVGTALASYQTTQSFTLVILHDIALAWIASPTTTVNGYNVYRGAQGAEALYAELGDTVGYVDTGVTPGQTYCYYVTAVVLENNVIQAESAPSNEVCTAL